MMLEIILGIMAVWSIVSLISLEINETVWTNKLFGEYLFHTEEVEGVKVLQLPVNSLHLIGFGGAACDGKGRVILDVCWLGSRYRDFILNHEMAHSHQKARWLKRIVDWAGPLALLFAETWTGLGLILLASFLATQVVWLVGETEADLISLKKSTCIKCWADYMTAQYQAVNWLLGRGVLIDDPPPQEVGKKMFPMKAKWALVRALAFNK